MAPSFSATALRAQEHVINNYVDRFVDLIGKLDAARSEEGIDMNEVDIIGELSFGESFDAIKQRKSGVWVSLLLDGTWMPMWAFAGLKKRFPAIMLLFPFVMPKKAAEMCEQHKSLTKAKVRKRMEMEEKDVKGGDFSNPVIRDVKRGKESEDYLMSESSFFAIAGAETTATCMTAALYFLHMNPECLSHLQKEVRTTFSSYDQINGTSTAALPYLHAVLEESLRRFNSVVMGAPRISPGTEIDGHYVAPGITVSTQPWVAHHNPKDFVRPDSFIPER